MLNCQLEISLGQFRRNLEWVQGFLPGGVRFCVTMKGDAYGHGLEALLPVVLGLARPPDYIAVCSNAEALKVAEAISMHVPPGAGRSPRLLRIRASVPGEWQQVHGPAIPRGGSLLEELVTSAAMARGLDRFARGLGIRVPVHVAVDTGYGLSGIRVGMGTGDDWGSLEEIVRGMPNLRVVSFMTHFPSADGDARDIAASYAQLRRFLEVRQRILSELGTSASPAESPWFFHCANSAAMIRMPESHLDMVRPGAACYGHMTSYGHYRNPESLRTLMTFRAAICDIKQLPEGAPVGYGGLWRARRPTRMAVLATGLAEGYPRALTNRAGVVIKGQRYPIVGRVALNTVGVDITDAPVPIGIGDVAVLAGRDGNQEISFEELADLSGSVHTEINMMLGRFAGSIRYVGESAPATAVAGALPEPPERVRE